MATFVYAVLTLGSVGQGDHGDFVPHISITVTLVLMVVDLAVLIYFLHHIAIQIQLPQVIAGDRARPGLGDRAAGGRPDGRRGRQLRGAADRRHGRAGRGRRRAAQRLPAVHPAPRPWSGSPPRRTRSSTCATGPGHFLVQGHSYATVWPASAADQVARELARAHVTGPYRTLAQDVSFGLDQLVEIGIRALSPAVNDTFTALTCIDWIGDSLCKVTGRWQPTRVYRDAAGTVRVIATQTDLRAAGAARVREGAPGRPRHARGDDPAAGRAGEDHGTGGRAGRPRGAARPGGDDRAAERGRPSTRSPTGPTCAAPTSGCSTCTPGWTAAPAAPAAPGPPAGGGLRRRGAVAGRPRWRAAPPSTGRTPRSPPTRRARRPTRGATGRPARRPAPAGSR